MATHTRSHKTRLIGLHCGSISYLLLLCLRGISIYLCGILLLLLLRLIWWILLLVSLILTHVLLLFILISTLLLRSLCLLLLLWSLIRLSLWTCRISIFIFTATLLFFRINHLLWENCGRSIHISILLLSWGNLLRNLLILLHRDLLLYKLSRMIRPKRRCDIQARW